MTGSLRIWAHKRRASGLGLACALSLAVLLPPGAGAFEAVRFDAGDAPEEVRADLQASSVLLLVDSDQVTDPARLLAAARADYQRLLGALYKHGYYGGVIRIRADGAEVAELPATATLPDLRRIEVSIDPGPKFQFRRADIGPLAPRTELPESYTPGGPAGYQEIKDAARAAVEGWRHVGHAKAEPTRQRITADHAGTSVSSEIGITPGPLVHFGKVRLARLSAVRAARIAEIAQFPTGKIFDPDAREAAADRLRRTGAFQAVVFHEDDGLNPDDTLDHTLDLIDAKPRRIGFGAEVSSSEGATLSGFWMHRNLLGGAERLRFDISASSIDGATEGPDIHFKADFRRPATFHPDVTLYAVAEAERLDEPDYTSDDLSTVVGLSRRIDDGLTLSAGVGLRFAEDEDALGKRDYHQVIFPLTATLDRRDDPLAPGEGYYVDGELRPFLGFDGSDSGARLELDARGYHRVATDGRVVLAGRLQFGTIAGADLLDVPNEDRFFSGGSETVRGQAYQSLGFDLGGGVRSGGASFVGLSGEVRVAVNDRLDLAAFADLGAIYREGWLDGDSADHAGVGLGAQFDTRFGPVRLDIATPVEGGDNGDLFFYLGFGHRF